MTLPVLIERLANNGYRAKTGERLPLTAEGASREEALGNLKKALQDRLQNGSELISLVAEPPNQQNPWMPFAGMFKDDPDFEEVGAWH
jgi:predicted RNase H-like HicB family nuclease